jgi:predicted kinase
MTKQENIELPILVVVTGRPASGKTTLAHALAKAVRCPLISRDEIKEGFINTLKSSGQSHNDINRHIYTTFFATLEFLLNQRITLVAEAAFQHQVWLPKLDPLKEIARIRLIHCTIDAQLAKSRFVERSAADVERVQYHDDLTLEAARESIERLIENYEPPQMDVPTLIVDTTDGYQPSFAEIVAFIRNPPPDALQ